MTDLATFNPFDPDTLQCPFPHYAQMRDEQPVMYLESMGMYLVTRHDLVLKIVRDVETYSSQFGVASMAMPGDARGADGRGHRRGVPAGPHDAHCGHARSHAVPTPGLEGVHPEGDRRTRTGDPIDHDPVDRRVVRGEPRTNR